MADKDPTVDADDQGDARTTEVFGGQAGDQPGGEGTDEVSARDEDASTVENRIDEVKRKTEEMAEGDKS